MCSSSDLIKLRSNIFCSYHGLLVVEIFYCITVLISFREIWSHHSLSGVVADGWLGECPVRVSNPGPLLIESDALSTELPRPRFIIDGIFFIRSFISVSVCLFYCLSICQSVCLFVCRSVRRSRSISLSMSVSLTPNSNTNKLSIGHFHHFNLPMSGPLTHFPSTPTHTASPLPLSLLSPPLPFHQITPPNTAPPLIPCCPLYSFIVKNCVKRLKSFPTLTISLSSFSLSLQFLSLLFLSLSISRSSFPLYLLSFYLIPHLFPSPASHTHPQPSQQS